MEGKFITFGIMPDEEIKFSEIGCGTGLKPYGGICGYERGTKAGDYRVFCEKNNSCTHLLYGIMYSIKPDARIYTINSWADIEILFRKYPKLVTVKKDGKLHIIDLEINYKAMSKDYDIIDFTTYAISNTSLSEAKKIDLYTSGIIQMEQKDKYSLNRLIEVNTSGWESACIYIFRRDVICNIEPYQWKTALKVNSQDALDEIMKELLQDNDIKKLCNLLNNALKDGKLDELVNEAKKAKYDIDKFHRLLDYLEGMIVLRDKMGSMEFHDYDAVIENTAKELYKMSVMDDSFESFKEYLLKVLEREKESKKKREENASKAVFQDEILGF